MNTAHRLGLVRSLYTASTR